MLPEDKVGFESREVGSGCTVREGRFTHTQGRLAASTVTGFVLVITTGFVLIQAHRLNVADCRDSMRVVIGLHPFWQRRREHSGAQIYLYTRL